MLKRSPIAALLTLCVTTFSGCPPVPEVQPGDWVFSFYDQQGGLYYRGGLTLNSDGTTAGYPVQGNVVQYVTGWWQEGDQFTVEQEIRSVHVWYIATVESSKDLEGESFDVNANTVIGAFTVHRRDPIDLQQ